MVGEQLIQLREFGNNIVAAVPCEAGAVMDFDFFSGKPFDAASKTEAAIDAGQRAKTVSQQ